MRCKDGMSMSIFDLEQQMLDFANVTKDIDLVTRYFMDSSEWHDHISPKASDAMINKYLAIKELYEIKFDEMWGAFDKVCKEYHENAKIRSA